VWGRAEGHGGVGGFKERVARRRSAAARHSVPSRRDPLGSLATPFLNVDVCVHIQVRETLGSLATPFAEYRIQKTKRTVRKEV